MVECLPNISKTLNLAPSTEKENRNRIRLYIGLAQCHLIHPTALSSCPLCSVCIAVVLYVLGLLLVGTDFAVVEF